MTAASDQPPPASLAVAPDFPSRHADTVMAAIEGEPHGIENSTGALRHHHRGRG